MESVWIYATQGEGVRFMAGSVAIDLDRLWGGGVSGMISSRKVLARANTHTAPGGDCSLSAYLTSNRCF